MKRDLKTDPQIFPHVANNFKRSEIRKDDRDPPYAVDDELILHETKHSGIDMAGGAPLEYTGKKCRRIVTHCLRGEEYGVAPGFVSMSIRPLTRIEKEAEQ